MHLNPAQKLKHIAELIKAEFIGDPDHLVGGLNEIHKVEAGDLMFVDHPKYYEKALNSKATTILINKKVECPAGKALLIVEDPFSAYNSLVKHFNPVEYSLKPVSDSSLIGLNTVVMPGVYIGRHVKIGDNCVIYPNVVIYDHTEIGDNVIIHAGTVIGSDAFYYKKRADHFDKMISCGRVVIHNDVEIGSLCSIDKGVSGDTIIGKGTKIDDHVHIGHDTTIGEMCLFAAQVGIAGAVKIGNRVTIWGQAGISSGLTINDGAVVLAQSGVGKDIEAGKSVFGSPAGDAREKMRELNYVKRIPELLNKGGSESEIK
jgi:UDP-3-O-[3-hydroxymyristoyl] glucosamine N-acyltransferase